MHQLLLFHHELHCVPHLTFFVVALHIHSVVSLIVFPFCKLSSSCQCTSNLTVNTTVSFPPVPLLLTLLPWDYSYFTSFALNLLIHFFPSTERILLWKRVCIFFWTRAKKIALKVPFAIASSGVSTDAVH